MIISIRGMIKDLDLDNNHFYFEIERESDKNTLKAIDMQKNIWKEQLIQSTNEDINYFSPLKNSNVCKIKLKKHTLYSYKETTNIKEFLGIPIEIRILVRNYKFKKLKKIIAGYNYQLQDVIDG